MTFWGWITVMCILAYGAGKGSNEERFLFGRAAELRADADKLLFQGDQNAADEALREADVEEQHGKERRAKTQKAKADGGANADGRGGLEGLDR